MQENLTIEEIDEVVAAIRSRVEIAPRVGLILGSGLSHFAESVENAASIPFSDLPHWPVSTVKGHSGRLVLGQLEGQDVFVMQGRIHFYEGYTMQQVTLPVRVMQRMGVEILVVTNAAGGIADAHQPGDVMLITDHINFPGLIGKSPMHGPNLDEFGPRFPDMTQAYDPELLDLARKIANENNVPFHEGVYVGLSGPSFETPAELRFLKMIGGDSVGMSTVTEVSVARHGGMRVLGLSGISNKAHTDLSFVATHEDVLEAGKQIVPKMETIIRGVLRTI
ncbi:MAG: purine-nucleoside phosphorylase [Anaerolineae bacterium]|jgi:purine-nucleoside phosphorylase|nr:purine-nucleoside phosphorylase [Anaerolineae bacterium]MBT7073153.1 purine-nucleoside phosphorylase [Anaerolineae bacterium]MBT7326621.1 purine-nucleoside phosphorylase [Anaerolineae bacterium]